VIHFEHTDWKAYIHNEVSEDKREKMEDHLYTCDQCLDVYMELMTDDSITLPLVSNENFTDKIMSEISFKSDGSMVKRTFYQHPIFHYVIAASITFILMTSGFFQNITGIVSTVEAASITEQEEAVSSSLMNKVLSLFEIIEPKHKDGEEHE
jgi:hypothetical protein